MVTPETLAAALRVAQHNAHIAMLAARANAPAAPIDQASPADAAGHAPAPAPATPSRPA